MSKAGKRFTYSELGITVRVTVLRDDSDDEFERYTVRCDEALGTYPPGSEFDIAYKRSEANILWKLTPL